MYELTDSDKAMIRTSLLLTPHKENIIKTYEKDKLLLTGGVYEDGKCWPQLAGLSVDEQQIKKDHHIDLDKLYEKYETEDMRFNSVPNWKDCGLNARSKEYGDYISFLQYLSKDKDRIEAYINFIKEEYSI